LRFRRLRGRSDGVQCGREQVSVDRVRLLSTPDRLCKAHPHARGIRRGGMEAMRTTIEDLDLKRYGRLLARAVPKVIKTEEENERALAIVESLMEKGEENMTPEEDALLELLTGLIHDFEEKAYPIPKSEPHRMV